MFLTKTIKLPIYDCSVKFILSDNIKKEIGKITKKYKIPNDTEDGDEYEGLVIFPKMSSYYLLVDYKHLSYNTLLHETYHLASLVCKQRDIENEEASAWICGFVGSDIIKFLLKKDVKIK